MNPGQYYGSPANFMPMPTANPYYQPPIMSPRPPDPPVPQTNQVPHFSSPAMNQPIPVSQYAQPQYQYNNQNASYGAVNPGVQNSTPYQPSQQNPPLNQGSVAPSSMMQNYQCSQPNQMPFYQAQNVPVPNYTTFPNSNQYADTMKVQGVYNTGQTVQSAYSVPANNQGNFYPPPVVDHQKMSYSPTPNTSTMPTSQAGEPSTNTESPPSKEPTQEEVQKFRPTNVIGEYKCSDFPNLFTGPFRYSGSPVQRKPFTLKNDLTRHTSQPNTERRTHIGLARHAKRWELRGGKYYGCFTSRTNGLQDICPKAKCKLCPTDKRK